MRADHRQTTTVLFPFSSSTETDRLFSLCIYAHFPQLVWWFELQKIWLEPIIRQQTDFCHAQWVRGYSSNLSVSLKLNCIIVVFFVYSAHTTSIALEESVLCLFAWLCWLLLLSRQTWNGFSSALGLWFRCSCSEAAWCYVIMGRTHRADMLCKNPNQDKATWNCLPQLHYASAAHLFTKYCTAVRLDGKIWLNLTRCQFIHHLLIVALTQVHCRRRQQRLTGQRRGWQPWPLL